MLFSTKGVKEMQTQKELKSVNPGTVIPGCNSQKGNLTGVHWLRNSFDFKCLDVVIAMVSRFFGVCELSYNGILSYTARYVWQSGVSLCFDEDPELRLKSHRDRITLDIPGSACDELTAPDLVLLLEFVQELGGKCTRIDVFFDDYVRTVSLEELRTTVDKHDFSGFRIASKNQTLDRTKKENGGVTYDAVTFGRRGSAGSGKYLRVYDKNLESKGEENCIRFEQEYSQHYAEKVFKILAGTGGNLECFAICCGALIGGSIKFVHRNGDKNIDRLELYDWWEEIVKALGILSIRIAKKKNTLTGMMEWTERQFAPTLSVIGNSFKTERDLYDWLQELRDVGDSKMNAHQRQVSDQNSGCLVFNPKCNREKNESAYLNAMCVQIN